MTTEIVTTTPALLVPRASRGAGLWSMAGANVEGVRTADEVCERTGMRDVRKAPLFVYGHVQGAPPQMIQTHRMIMDGNSPLGICGVDKGLVQPRELLNVLQPLVDEDEAGWATAGKLRKGRTIYGQVLMNGGTWDVVKGDEVRQHCLATLSYDGRAIYVRFCRTRVLCWNGLMAAIQESGRMVEADGSDEVEDGEELKAERDPAQAVRVIHSANVHERLEQATRILGIAAKTNQREMEFYRTCARARLNSAGLDKFFRKVLPDDPDAESNATRERARLEWSQIHDWNDGTDGVAGVRGTLWGAINAITAWTHWGRGTLRGKPVAQLASPQARLSTVFVGSGSRMAERAKRAAVEVLGYAA